MNGQRIAVIVTPPGADGWGAVSYSGQQRQCWFKPARFAAPNPVPLTADRVFITFGAGRRIEATWLLGKGTPA